MATDSFFVVKRNVAVKKARGVGIDVPGLADLRRDLRKMAPETDKELRRELRAAATPIRARARELAPEVSGDLKRSLRTSVTTKGVAIRSGLPYANLIHWGGSTGKGHVAGRRWSGASRVRESLFLSRAIEENEDDLYRALDAAVDKAARRHGWR